MRVFLRRILYTSTLWLAIGLLITGCTSFKPIATEMPTLTQQRRVPAICGTINGELASLWDPTADGNGGFGNTPSFAAQPSLYYTTWSLRLASEAKVKVLNLDKMAVAKEIIGMALDSNSSTQDAHIPLVERLSLTTKALQSLHLAIPDSFLTMLSSLRMGSQYRSDPGAKSANWSATYLAVLTMAAAGRQIPDGVLEGARKALAGAKLANTPQAITSIGIPVLGTLSAVPGLLRRLAPDTAPVLSTYMRVLLKEGGVSAITAANLTNVVDIAESTGLSAPSIPSAFLSPLLTPSGFYSVWEGGRFGNPQATFYAVRLGMPLTSGARSTLAFGHVKQGWLSSKSGVTINSTFQAALTAHACQTQFPHLVAFDHQILQWTQDVSSMEASVDWSATPAPSIEPLLASIAETCFLANFFGVNLNEELHASLTTAVNHIAIRLLPNVGGIPTAGQVASAVELCHIALLANTQKSLFAYLKTAKASTIEDALSLHIASIAFIAPSLDVRARSVALRLRTRDGLYFFKEGAVQADLLSTSYGYAVTGGTEKERVQAEEVFETPWGPSLSTPGSVSNSPPVVDLASLAAGLSLLSSDTGMPPLF